jgi:hypothetical protein
MYVWYTRCLANINGTEIIGDDATEMTFSHIQTTLQFSNTVNSHTFTKCLCGEAYLTVMSSVNSFPLGILLLFRLKRPKYYKDH